MYEIGTFGLWKKWCLESTILQRTSKTNAALVFLLALLADLLPLQIICVSLTQQRNCFCLSNTKIIRSSPEGPFVRLHYVCTNDWCNNTVCLSNWISSPLSTMYLCKNLDFNEYAYFKYSTNLKCISIVCWALWRREVEILAIDESGVKWLMNWCYLPPFTATLQIFDNCDYNVLSF